MKRTTPQNRRILLVPLESGALQDSDLSPDPIFQPKNGSSETRKNPTTSSLDSSMALTILVLLTALLFMGFFSIYIRRFSEEDSADNRRRRHPSRPSSASPGGLRNQKAGCGLDPSTVSKLPRVSYCGVAKQLITECPICLSEFEEREIVKLIPNCRHVFHPECIDTWLASHVSCPLCRTTQFFKLGDGHEVSLDVVEDENCNGVGDVGGRSTAGDYDTWRDIGMRRTCSCTSFGDRLVLQRSMSF